MEDDTELLDAINEVLRASAAPLVNEVNESNEQSALGQTMLRRSRRRILSNGYPFNQNEISLVVDNSGRVPVASSYLKLLLPEGTSVRKDADTGGLFLWDIVKNDWSSQPLQHVKVVFDIVEDDFSLIPELFAAWITARSALEFWQETNQSDAPWLREREQLAESEAINNLPPMTTHQATGYSALRSLNTGTPPTTGRAWVVVS